MSGPRLLSSERLAALKEMRDYESTRVWREAPIILEETLAHIAALEADNAALFEALKTARLYVNALAMGSPRFDSDGELALRDELDGALKQPHPGTTLLAEHAKALMKARNEGLEKAAAHAKAASTCRCSGWDRCGCNWEAKLDDLESDIRALKEPEL